VLKGKPRAVEGGCESKRAKGERERERGKGGRGGGKKRSTKEERACVDLVCRPGWRWRWRSL